jgi:trk system potassium uptake protein TrkA
MKVIIVGCGRLGVELSYRLYQRGHDVAVIDSVAAAFNNLPPDFQGRTIEGEALSLDVLRRAGIESADGLAVVTNQDELNAVVAHIARSVYKVPNIAVRNYDPHSRPMLEIFGFQMVSSTSWGAQRIEEILFHEGIHSVYSAGNGEVEVYEVIVPEEWNKRFLNDLLTTGQTLPSSISRAGRAFLPTPDTRLETGDVLHFAATIEGVDEVRKHLNELSKSSTDQTKMTNRRQG